jgi:hypothetical protein
LKAGLYVTPLNRAAAAVLPEVLPAGFVDQRQIPLSRYAAGVIYDLAEPARAREWLAPVLARMKWLEGSPTMD